MRECGWGVGGSVPPPLITDSLPPPPPSVPSRHQNKKLAMEELKARHKSKARGDRCDTSNHPCSLRVHGGIVPTTMCLLTHPRTQGAAAGRGGGAAVRRRGGGGGGGGAAVGQGRAPV